MIVKSGSSKSDDQEAPVLETEIRIIIKQETEWAATEWVKVAP
jgi:hypothetical protein